ncbi:chain length determinant protein tyrosine kinase EpsG [Thiomicrorhabdus sp.]|uniref:chain length determinant protein tyrosine kinase EpsG n=1 Tax=Thiomicrorhabdus sp. TaxID=2039724 RepID=UPI003561F00E
MLQQSITQSSIGDILTAAGKLEKSDVDRITEYQRKQGLPFGEAAIELNILSRKELDLALSKQFDYAYLDSKSTSLSPELVSLFKPFSKVGESFRDLRSQLALKCSNMNGVKKQVAIVSPQSGDGRSFMAANLAVMFAQLGQKTLLIDAAIRNPRQDKIFNLQSKQGLSSYLSGRADLAVIEQVDVLPELSVLSAGPVAPNPQELLSKESFKHLLQYADENFDMVLIDTPSSDESADAEIIASQAGACLIVCRMNKSMTSKISKLSNRLQDSGVVVFGAVANEY